MEPYHLSILIPVYNVEKYIERCMRSVFAQNYQDIECVLVNDSTPYKSFQIAKELIDGYHGRIVLIPKKSSLKDI